MKTVSVALGDGDSHVDIVIGNIDDQKISYQLSCHTSRPITMLRRFV